VVKLNVDSDDQYAFTRAIADHVLVNYAGVLRVDGGVGEKDAYDPRAWGRKGEAAMASGWPRRVSSSARRARACCASCA